MATKTKNCWKTAEKLTICAVLVIYLTGCSFAGISGSQSASSDAEKKVTKSDFALDTVVSVTLYGTDDPTLAEGCLDLCHKYELVFSRTDSESELYALNEQNSMTVSDDLLSVITTALHYCEVSNGAFDITLGEISDMYGFTSDSPSVPPQDKLDAALAHVGYQHIHVDGHTVTIDDPETVVDLGAIAKGYIADRLADYLKENGQQSAVIDLGGNVYCVGTKPDGSDYNVGIQYPFEDTSKTITTVHVSNMSVVTSGIYERSFEQDGVLYHHILNPQTGYPYDNGLLAVSIVSEKSVDGDALSTTCFALGLDGGLALINSLDGIYAVFVTDDYQLHYSDGFQAALEQ